MFNIFNKKNNKNDIQIENKDKEIFLKSSLSFGFFKGGKKVSNELLREIENELIRGDIGVKTAVDITNKISKKYFDKNITEEQIKEEVRLEIYAMLEKVEPKENLFKFEKLPYIIVMVGTNGCGKTTTIGKISNALVQENKKVLIAAADTFRAAAIEQLNVWAQKSGADFFSKKEGSDPASVCFEAIKKAQDENYDCVIIDTAGRLQNKIGLMEELEKIGKVIEKAAGRCADNVILTLDGTVGQNSVEQVKIFGEAINVDNIVMTKLDGTAKGGILVSIANEFNGHIMSIGVGEKIDDIYPFNAKKLTEKIIG